MTLTPDKLLPKIEKAGIKASLKAGHIVTREELLEVKVQLMPTLLRWALGGLAAASAYGSYLQYQEANPIAGMGFILLALLFFFFAVAGIRKTLGNILEGLIESGYTDTGNLLGMALECIGAAIGSLFDGV